MLKEMLATVHFVVEELISHVVAFVWRLASLIGYFNKLQLT